MLLSIDGTFLIQILNFVAFWMLLNWLFIAPTRRAIEARQRAIAKLHADADAARARARALEAEATGLLDAARRRTDEIMREGSAKAAASAKEIERLAAEEAAATVALAQAKVATERADAAAKQGVFVHELARSMAQRALGAESVV
ncbi:MAG TPA: hypothetical protein VFO25_01845 [Candidatus Eremiobacteraceae bacterium]|nr:hypothetical protein [Candidatus Eremiobacteraceae bacterium]